MIIGVVNNKGGVLKTTLSTNLAATLSLKGKKVIIVDLDGQGNVIATFGKNPNNMEHTIIDFLRNECNLNDCILELRNNLYVIPGNDDLNFFDYYVQSSEIKQSDLKLTLKKLNEVYDYVIIDTPPNMSTVVAIVLSVCNTAIIPFEPDQYAILGLKRIVDATKEFINKGNSQMKVIAVPTKVNTRVTIHNEIIESNIRPKLVGQGVYVTRTYISASTKSTASVGYEKVPIVFSVVKSKYQDEYFSLRDEILNYLYPNENAHQEVKPTSTIETTQVKNETINQPQQNTLTSTPTNTNQQTQDNNVKEIEKIMSNLGGYTPENKVIEEKPKTTNIYGTVVDYNTFYKSEEDKKDEEPCLSFNYSDKKEDDK